ncbi:hypothetical protein BC332_18156 [Capsicum chinense]|nr:hypothetical protein BC332_18156 [Capsicum chinense]
MYRCVSFPLAFQYWFYECCPYVDGFLADRVGYSVPHILNWFVKHRPTYQEVKSTFFDIRQEQVVLSNITPMVLDKSILQLPDSKSMDAVVNSADLSGTSKQECSHLAQIMNYAKISKFTQPDKSVAMLDATGIVCDNVIKVDANASDNFKGIEKNMVAASVVMLDETPVISRRLRKPAAVCESSFLSKFDSGCGKVEGQPSRNIENAQLS